MAWPTGKGPFPCKHDGCDDEFDMVQKLAAHVRTKHPKPAPDSSDDPVDGSTVDRSGELKQPQTPTGEPPSEYIPPVVGQKMKYGFGLSPWLNLIGMSVYTRNNYDGLVIQKGIPPLIEAIDLYAEQNEVLYNFLKAIALTDSPQAKLIIAALAIIVPILANHRPDSNMLRNITGGLRMMPGTDIPPLPSVMAEPEGEAMEEFVQQAKTTLESMTEEDQQRITEAMMSIPPDVMAKMMTNVHPGGMTHPEATATDGEE